MDVYQNGQLTLLVNQLALSPSNFADTYIIRYITNNNRFTVDNSILDYPSAIFDSIKMNTVP